MNSSDFLCRRLVSRADFQRFVTDVWRALEAPCRKMGADVLFGQQRCGYGLKAESMEGFARIFWGLGPLRAGGGGEEVDWGLLRSILLAGVRPGGWGPMKDYDQRIVETPAIALGLVWARDVMWDPLSPGERLEVVAWIGRINAVQVIENNWLWFRVLTNAALRKLGEPHDAEREAADLALLDAMWHGTRGYSDGPEEHRDYYVPMAMHFYGLVYARLIEKEAPDRAAELRMRAGAYAPEFLAWFANDGAAPAFGRSLHYRFAQGAMWAALAYGEDEPALSWGVLRGLVARHLRQWLERPVFTEDGKLSVGYGYNQPVLAEGYASSSSPNWALKTLLILALPESHPFWQAKEESMPTLPAASVSADERLVVTRPGDGRDVVLLAASQSRRDWLRHNEAKYHKFAYSAQFGVSISLGQASLSLLAPDCALALSDDGAHWRVRDTSGEIRCEGTTLITSWQPWPDVSIETRLAPDEDGNGHVREHVIRTERTLHAFEGGFCVPRDVDAPVVPAVCGHGVTVCSQGYGSEIRDGDGSREAVVITTDTNTHMLWPWVYLPGLQETLAPGTHVRRCRVRGWREDWTA